MKQVIAPYPLACESNRAPMGSFLAFPLAYVPLPWKDCEEWKEMSRRERWGEMGWDWVWEMTMRLRLRIGFKASIGTLIEMCGVLPKPLAPQCHLQYTMGNFKEKAIHYCSTATFLTRMVEYLSRHVHNTNTLHTKEDWNIGKNHCVKSLWWQLYWPFLHKALKVTCIVLYW